MNWSDTSLKILSLTKTEIAILNVINDVSKNVQDISLGSKISRTGINHALKYLMKKGLVNCSLIGKRRVYTSVDLVQLTKKFQQVLDQIEISRKDTRGAKIKISKEDEFIIHVGLKEIIPAFKRIAFENKNERVRGIQHHRSWKELINKITPQQLIEFNQTIKDNKIIIDGILNKSAYISYKKEIQKDPQKHTEAIKSLEGRMADYTIFPDEFFKHDAEMWIFKTTTLIINWKEEIAIEITNKNMTGFLKDMFEFVKKSGSKVNHNETVRKLLEV